MATYERIRVDLRTGRIKTHDNLGVLEFHDKEGLPDLKNVQGSGTGIETGGRKPGYQEKCEVSLPSRSLESS